MNVPSDYGLETVFEILDASSPKDRLKWLRILERWPSYEVSAHPAYLELFAGPEDRVLAATLHSSEKQNVLYPFIQRPIRGQSGKTEYTDITTPYGYGGPFVWGTNDASRAADEFWLEFGNWAKRESVVSEFIRFSLFQKDLLPFAGEVIKRQPNIVVDLDQDEDSLWMSFEKKVRKNVKRAQRDGVVIEVVLDGSRFKWFDEIYRDTMERRNAAESYLFDAHFFAQIHGQLEGQFAYFFALINEKPVSSELVLVSKETIYSFLGGTDQEAFPSRPNDLLKFEIMKWGQANDKKNFVLGGGYEQGDGIERYKRSFAPKGITDFKTGQFIHDLHAYNKLASDVEGSLSESSYFPRYREPRITA